VPMEEEGSGHYQNFKAVYILKHILRVLFAVHIGEVCYKCNNDFWCSIFGPH